MAQKERVSLYLEDEEKEKLKNVAEKLGSTPSKMVSEYLKEFDGVLEKNNNDYLIIRESDDEDEKRIDILQLLENLKPYLSAKQFQMSYQLANNFDQVKVLNDLMKITYRENKMIEINPLKENKTKLELLRNDWELYLKWLWKSMDKLIEKYEAMREGWRSRCDLPYFWGCEIKGYVFDFGWTQQPLKRMIAIGGKSKDYDELQKMFGVEMFNVNERIAKKLENSENDKNKENEICECNEDKKDRNDKGEIKMNDTQRVKENVKKTIEVTNDVVTVLIVAMAVLEVGSFIGTKISEKFKK